MYSEGMIRCCTMVKSRSCLEAQGAACGHHRQSLMSNFRQFDRATGSLLPPSLDEWLLKLQVGDGKELSWQRFGRLSSSVIVIVGPVGLRLHDGSSCKLERATYDSVAFRFIAANDHPDHDTIATFRRRFFKDIETLFVWMRE
jgi:hypothetical protein